MCVCVCVCVCLVPRPCQGIISITLLFYNNPKIFIFLFSFSYEHKMCKNFIDRISNFILQLTFKKPPPVQFWCTMQQRVCTII